MPEKSDLERAPVRAPRLDAARAAPTMYAAMLRFAATAREGLDPTLVELVNIRASQLNHCAFCLDVHTRDALAAGETIERIVTLSAWAEARHFYTEKELAALELTEAVTVLTSGFVPDDVWERVAAHFAGEELAQLLGAIAAINALNRLAVTSRLVAGRYRAGAH